MTESAENLRRNLATVRDAIAQACERAGRDPDDIVLIAVSKTHDDDAIQTLYDEGVRDFGESYAQEWEAKIERLPDDIRWHFIGHLQSNKARMVVDRVQMVHSVDRKSLMKKLNRRSAEPVDVLLQINVAEDPKKSGAAPEDALDLLKQARNYPDLRIRGVMTIPPYGEDEETTRGRFRTLKSVFDELHAYLEEEDPEAAALFEHLSMGMSADYALAVEEGATMVRVGTALFGERDYD